jgi:uncharacterized protein (DUF1697 family)
MQTWVVLLRGINVGGRNTIPMQHLREAFAAMGYVDPQTYIQSGNVVIDARGTPGPSAIHRIEQGLSTSFAYDATVVIRDLAQMRTVVDQVPEDWDGGDADMRYNVLFPVHGLSPADIVASVRPKPGLESIVAGTHAIYWSAPFATLSKTAMVKLSAHPLYRRITVRNLATTTTLLSLMAARSAREPPGPTDVGRSQ